VVAGGTSPLVYQWYSNTSSNYDGATLLTDGGGVSGSTNVSLTIADLSAYYFVVVTNNYGSITSAVVTAANSSPLFISQLPMAYSNMWLYPGFNHTFSVTAVGASPLYYQWFTNGVPAGSPASAGSSVSTSLILTNVQTPFANYYCVVSNSLGSSTSFVWSASIVPVPSNYAQAVAALNPVGYWRLNEPDDGYYDGNPYVICHDYVGGNDALYTNVYLGQQGYNMISDPTDTSMLVGSYSAVNSYAGRVGTNVDFAAPVGGNGEFSVEAWVSLSPSSNGGIVTKGWSGGGEEFSLDTVNSSHHFEFYVRTAYAQTAGAITAASSITPQSGMWYHLVGVCDQANGNVLLYVNGTLAARAAINPGLGIVNSSAWPLTIGARAANQNSDENGYTVQSQGYINDVAVFNYALSSNQVANEYVESGIAPFFTQVPPNSVNIANGSNLVVVAAVIGTLPLSYQWYETNLVAMTGYAVSGQTNAILVFSNDAASDSYYLIVTNIYGTTNSPVIAVGVYTGPMFTSYLPVPHTNLFTLYAGSSATFSVAAISLQNGQPVYFQWYANGMPKDGATGPNLNLLSVQAGALTNFYCVVSNFLGATTSFVWSASVVVPPTNPYPQAVLSLHPIGYWRLDEPDDGMGDYNAGVIAHDYVGGNDGIYTNTLLSGVGYSAPPSYSAFDPNLIAPCFGFAAFANCTVYGVEGIDFSSPSNTSKAFSVEAWVNGYQQTKDAGVVTKGYGGGGEQFDLDTGSDGGSPSHAYRFLVRDASGLAHSVNSSIQPDSVWHHLVGVCDEPNGSVTLYVDGQSVGSAAIPTNGGILESTSLMSIGSRYSTSAAMTANMYDNQFVGFVNDVAVFDYALTAAQVTNEYQGIIAAVSVNQTPTNIMASVSGNHLTLTWPSDHMGWQLQVQTNNLNVGLGTNWVNVSDSTNVNQMVVPLNATNGSVFYRLVYPPYP
jgi:Concanavalin A-like lectin/glucanases superfamily